MWQAGKEGGYGGVKSGKGNDKRDARGRRATSQSFNSIRN